MVHASKKFDLWPLRRSERWRTIQTAMNEYFVERYRDNKSAFKATHFLEKGRYGAVDEIQMNPPPNIELLVWEKHIQHYMDEKHIKEPLLTRRTGRRIRYTTGMDLGHWPHLDIDTLRRA